MDVEKLKAILAALHGTDVTRLRSASGEESLDLRLGHPPAAAQVVHAAPVAAAPVQAAPPAASSAPAPMAPAAPKADSKTFSVNSPFVGTFYRSASPENPAFVEVGTVVKKGQVLCIVEAMKLMNEIESEVAGKVVEILAQNAQPVEFGQPLFRVEPA